MTAAYAAWIGWLSAPSIAVDDAAISFRYAVRIAAGQGFTYNDHEHVLGASNPLYTLILAGGASTGLDVERAAWTLGWLLFVTSAVLAARIVSHLSTPLAGLLAGVLLASEPHFRYFALSGMESILAAALGLGCVLALFHGRGSLAGVLLGLAVWNKLDAGLFAIAVGGAWLIVHRQLPVRLICTSLLTVAPWLLFATVYFGSPIPNSLAKKLAGGEELPFDPLWVIRFYGYDWRWIPLLAGALWLAFWFRAEPRVRLAVGALAGWFLLHLLALSCIDLGAPYPWYLLVLLPSAVILGTSAVGRLPSRAVRLAAAGVVALPLSSWVPAAIAGQSRWIAAREAFEVDRREAGRFLARHSDPGEIVSSGFGWVAYEAPNPFNDETRLNSRMLLEPVMYRVLHGAPFDLGGIAPKAPDGYVLLATFDSAHRQAPNYSWFAVYGRPESKIGRGIAPGASARGRLRHTFSKRATKWSDRPKIRLAGHG